jgi:hypothetical protein
VVVVVLVVVVVVTHPEAVHASQQLANSPTHAVPPCGGTHDAALFFVVHFVFPVAVVRQHVTNPGFPQVERAAHFFTSPPQLLFTRTAFTCWAAQLT